MPHPSITVRIQRTGEPCLVHDPVLDCGHHFATGEARDVSVDLALALLDSTGWRLVLPSDGEPVTTPTLTE